MFLVHCSKLSISKLCIYLQKLLYMYQYWGYNRPVKHAVGEQVDQRLIQNLNVSAMNLHDLCLYKKNKYWYIIFKQEELK